MQNVATHCKRIGAIIVFSLFLAGNCQAADKELLMATTTSTDDTGLLDYLAPMVTKATTIDVKWVGTGTGKALKMGEDCNADVLLVHAPAAEKKFVEAGFGINRRKVMYNDFVVIGPTADPAAIQGKDVCTALQTILAKKSPFVSRGDDSGTHKMELSLWKDCALQAPDKESWYLQAGQGMMPTITMAAERSGYTLADRGTYIKYEADHQGKPPLAIILEGDKKLLNQYSVIEVNPQKCPKAKNDLARQYGDWMVGKEGQAAIGGFLLLNKQLFTPNAAGN
ncbi:MAG: ABC transporter substrate-binding protein [Desulfobulbaceae bacterium]